MSANTEIEELREVIENLQQQIASQKKMIDEDNEIIDELYEQIHVMRTCDLGSENERLKRENKTLLSENEKLKRNLVLMQIKIEGVDTLLVENEILQANYIKAVSLIP